MLDFHKTAPLICSWLPHSFVYSAKALMAMFEKKRMSAMHIQYINNSELCLPGYEMAGLYSINIFFPYLIPLLCRVRIGQSILSLP